MVRDLLHQLMNIVLEIFRSNEEDMIGATNRLDYSGFVDPHSGCFDPTDEFRLISGRSGHRIWVNGDCLFIIGGYNPESGSEDQVSFLLRDVWCQNLITGCWRKVAVSGSFPFEVASFALCGAFQQNRVVLTGGTGVPFGEFATNKIRVLAFQSPLKASFLDVAEFNEQSSDCPEPCYGQTLSRSCNFNEYIVIGGTTGHTYHMNVHAFTLKPNDVDEQGAKHDYVAIWTRIYKHIDGLTSLQPRYRHEAVQHCGKILVFGGGTRHDDCAYENIDVFDIKKRTWSIMSTSGDARLIEGGNRQNGWPVARKCHAIGFDAVNERVFIAGGQAGEQVHLHPDQNDILTRILNDVWMLDLKTSTWTKHTAIMPVRVFFHSGDMTSDGRLVLHGGVTKRRTYYKRIKSTFVLHTREPPSLKEFATRKLLEVSKFDRRLLNALYLPKQLMAAINFGEDAEKMLTSQNDAA